MSRVTVVTLPNETLEHYKPGKTVDPVRKIAWSKLFLLLRNMLVGLVHRDNLPVHVLAFLLGRVSIMGELSPFGLAFFTAVAQTDRERTLGVSFWALAGVISGGHHVEAAIYILAMAVYFRFAGTVTKVHRKFMAIPLVVFFAVLVGGLTALLWEEPTIYNCMLAFLDAFLCLVLSYIFMYAMPLFKESERKGLSGENMVCAMALLSTAIAGLGSFSVLDYSVRNIVGSLLVLFLAMEGGAGIGACAGVSVGVVVGLTQESSPYNIAAYAMAGMLAGMFRKLGRFAVCLGFILGSVIMLLYFSQAADLLAFLTENVVAICMVWVLPTGLLASSLQTLYDSKQEKANGQALIIATEKLNHIAEMFEDLAGAFGHISSDTRNKIQEEDLARVLSNVGEQVCGKCEMKSTCWEHDFYRTYQGVFEMLGLAEAGGLSADTMPQPLQEKCIKRKEMLATVNLAAERNRTCSFWQRKIADSRQMITEQMKATASILGMLVQEINKEPCTDHQKSVFLEEKSVQMECPLSDVSISNWGGTITLQACKQPCSGSRECVNTVLPMVSDFMQEKMLLHAQCGSKLTHKKCRLIMQAANRYGIQTGAAYATKAGQEVCGDTYAVVPLNKGKMALVLSDGMGSGAEAKGESGTAVCFLEKLLSVGFSVDIAVKTVNAMLLLRMPDESFATIDMVIFDNYSGQAEFLKVGSAPSYIKRIHEVRAIQSASLPVGILHQIEIEPVKTALSPGDIVVMVSDGIVDAASQGFERENWIANFLRRTEGSNPQEIAEKILQQALTLADGNVRDDMTVLAAKIVERPNIVQ